MQKASLQSRSFGTHPQLGAIEAWTLRGQGGASLEVLTYGVTVSRWLVPDARGILADIVLGFDNLEAYLKHGAYFGAFVGRVAGRIRDGRLTLGGHNSPLGRNEGFNHLHGGFRGFDKKVWTAEPVTDVPDIAAVRFSYTSADGEEGYPGTLRVTVTYSLTPENTVVVESTGTTDQATPFSPTLHHYFNLAGEAAGTIASHDVAIFADEFVPADDSMALLEPCLPVTGGNDLRQPRQLGQVIPLLSGNHGDLYRLRKERPEEPNMPQLAARLTEPDSGRVLEIFTTNNFLQLYTGKSLDGSLTGKSGARYASFSGLCLECEEYPDGAGKATPYDNILHPGVVWRGVTEYRSTCLPHGSRDRQHKKGSWIDVTQAEI